MSNLLKYGALAVGGYILAKYTGLLDGFNFPGVTTVGSGQTVNTGGETTASPQANTSTTVNGESATLAAVRAFLTTQHVNMDTDLRSIDTWNFAYHYVRGIDAPAPEDLFPGVDRNRNYSWAEYWAGMKAKGFSGMGAIARVNPYHNPLGGNFKFGDNISPTGMEMYIKRFN